MAIKIAKAFSTDKQQWTGRNNETQRHGMTNHAPRLMVCLAVYAIIGCVALASSILVADFVVPNHDWIADTISDLGAGRYEFIVDIGIYAFSGSLIALALLSSHQHLGDWRWSSGVVGLALLGLIVFLVGARNEYGDNDSEGVVIHVYLVYALGVLFTAIPLLMADGARKVSTTISVCLIALAIAWTVFAPIFFFLPDTIDGIYERFLGLIVMAIIIAFALLFLRRARSL